MKWIGLGFLPLHSRYHHVSGGHPDFYAQDRAALIAIHVQNRLHYARRKT